MDKRRRDKLEDRKRDGKIRRQKERPKNQKIERETDNENKFEAALIKSFSTTAAAATTATTTTTTTTTIAIAEIAFQQT